jgi:radical SAM protein with 4Fe4S-binding SPASM domain
MSLPYFLSPKTFTIQWHLTEKCNWRCKHCYRDGCTVKELNFKAITGILRQCLELFSALNVRNLRSGINIGGGEPFLRKDLFKFLSVLDRHKDLLRVTIMTNGSLITNEIVKKLEKIKVVRIIQVSLEGLSDSNDDIRGNGSFEKIVNAIKLLKKHNIITRVSLTVTKKNLPEIEKLAIYLKRIGVNSFGMRRYVPMGRGKQLVKHMLSPLELKEFYYKREELKKKLDEYRKFIISYGCEDGIFCRYYGLNYYHCRITEGDHLNIFANGNILACRRFPVVVGSVLKKDLLNVHFTSNKLFKYRNLENAHILCKKCPHFKYCLGGAMCVTSAYFGTPFAPDPQCWRLFKELPDQHMFKDERIE